LYLGIETSCDETAAAIVRDGREVLSSVVYSQVARHADYGGVVPEIAARVHVEVLPDILATAIERAGVGWDALDGVAVTVGPGLASSLLVGLSAAKALALTLGLPLIPVNHLEGHLYSVFLGEDAPTVEEACPMLVLLVTGGNTCLVRMDGIGSYRVLGQTLDDAAGEALDKGATLLGLGYPGGPAIERAAAGGDPHVVRFPRGLEHPRGGGPAGRLDRAYCFSFSGVKTALLYHLRDHPEDGAGDRRADLAASYQEAVMEALAVRVRRALRATGIRTLACVGGVARNQVLRAKLDRLLRAHGARLFMAPMAYCTDNAAMIAALAGATAAPADGEEAMAVDIAPSLPIPESPAA
jgi:N6-L-threonylcarbamoyladenine synthase